MAKNKKKNYQVLRAQVEKEQKYASDVKKLRLFPILALAMAVIVLFLFFTDWAFVHNTDVGTEVSVSGFNCLVSGTSGNYSGTEKAIGDMAMPFYYYAKAESVNLAGLTTAAFFVLLASIVAYALAAIRNKEAFNIAGLVLSFALMVLLFSCYSTALSMKNAKILSDYCSGNVKCSIRSEAVLPALLTLFSLALPVAEIIRRALLAKNFRAEKK